MGVPLFPPDHAGKHSAVQMIVPETHEITCKTRVGIFVFVMCELGHRAEVTHLTSEGGSTLPLSLGPVWGTRV